MVPRSYLRSQALLQRALRTIPVGSQTFSKSYLQYPEGCSPLFLRRGQGGRVWDVDGYEYVDLVSGLLPVVLGYGDPDVNQAIQAQLADGISLSLTTELEVELAERLVEIIPCAEMVRFGKNGSDATSAAIRLARAYTRRDRIAVCGYHGWHDWYVGATARNLGVPKCVSSLTHRFDYNDEQSLFQLLQDYPGEFAAVIMEPMNTALPQDNFLAKVKELAHKHGAIFILDEVITGFRYSLGGAQQLFGVTPDLATFGKAMANGMPLSAVVGRADIMSLMEDIFYSGTFGGETLSLAAAIAVVDKMKNEPVIDALWQKGGWLAEQVQQIIAEEKLDHVFSLTGMPPWMIISIKDQGHLSKAAIRTLFMYEMINQGVLIQSSHNITYAHTEIDLQQVVCVYRHALKVIAEALAEGCVLTSLPFRVVEPVFKVREG